MALFKKWANSRRRKKFEHGIARLKELTVANVMTKYVVSVRSEDTVINAATKMIAEDISCLAVIDDDDLKGILSERDFLLKVPLNKKVFDMKVAEIMTDKVITVTPETSLADAVAVMKKNNFRRLIAADGTKVRGIITQTDFSRVIRDELHAFPLSEHVVIDKVMTHQIISASSKDSFSKARDKMKKSNVGSILIMDGGVPLGIFTEYDVVMQFYDQHGELSIRELSNYMRKHVRAATSGMNIFDANKLLLEKNMRRLPVVKNEKILGIITQTDIVRFVFTNLRVLEEIAGKAEEFLDAPKEFSSQFMGEHIKVYN